MRPIDADDLQKSLNDYVFNDPTCPMHIAATVDQYIDFAPTVGGWISCSERTPEDDVKVLGNITITVNTNMAKPKQRTIFAKHDRVLGWTTANGYPIVGKITHWMPLPEPPGGDNNA